MKYLVKNKQIILKGIPSIFTRENGQSFQGGYENMIEFHYIDGFRNEIIPEFDEILEYVDFENPFYSESLDAVTFQVKLKPYLPSIEQAKITKILEVKDKAKEELIHTDWYIIRQLELNKKVPDEVISKRSLIRLRSDSIELEINNLNTLRQVLSYKITF